MTTTFNCIKRHSQGVVLTVRLTPRGRADRIEGFQVIAENKMALKVSVTEVPEDGKANKALINLLSKYFKLPKSDIKFISGETSRTKTLLINIDFEAIISAFNGLSVD